MESVLFLAFLILMICLLLKFIFHLELVLDLKDLRSNNFLSSIKLLSISERFSLFFPTLLLKPHKRSSPLNVLLIRVLSILIWICLGAIFLLWLKLNSN